SKSLEDVVLATAGNRNKTQQKIFNNAAQVWNHNLFWQCLSPDGGGKPSRPFGKLLDNAFGDLESFSRMFKDAATGQFGSGYAWLVCDAADKRSLKVVATSNAHPPFVDGQIPLLCCDVWEHAYYLDYEDRRAEFVEVFLEKLVNWDFATQCYEHRKEM